MPYWWKIALGYLILLIWCYMRAELHYQRTARAALAGGAGGPGSTSTPLRTASVILLVLAIALIVWGSGPACLFWLPAGFILTGLVQTLLPLRNRWR